MKSTNKHDGGERVKIKWKQIIKLKKWIRRLYYRWRVPRDTHRVGKDGVSTNLIRSKLIRHIGLRRKHQQKNGTVPSQTAWAPIWSDQNPLGTLGCGESINKKWYCAESKENGVLTNSRENAKKTKKKHGLVRSLTHYSQKTHSFVYTPEIKNKRAGWQRHTPPFF